MNPQARANLEAATALVDELARSGVRAACLSPGSRSAPLALALAAESRIRTRTITDERSAAFFALGMARETGRAVALICTSGTAAVQYGPALTEAYYSAIPLIAITADRPPELRDCGAPQTIWQSGLFTHHILWETEVSTPSPGSNLEPYYRTLACRAAAIATGTPRGPVHLNFCLREPLFETADLREEIVASRSRGRANQQPWFHVHPSPAANPEASRRLSELARTNERGVIVCGPGVSRAANAIATFADRTGWPILADPLSGLRHGRHEHGAVADAADLVLRSPKAKERLQPDVVLRLGGPPSSKPLQALFDPSTKARQWSISLNERGQDPFFSVEELLVGDTAQILTDSAQKEPSRRDSEWTHQWLEASRRARASIDAALDECTEPFEGHIAREVLEAIPPGTLMVVGNSTPARDVDTFARGRSDIELVGNRGANGIDGLIASALGAAAADKRPTLLLLGDLAYLHDVSSLQLAQQQELRATIVVVNNDGGQIFSRLPQGGLPSRERALFTTPHGHRVTRLFPVAGVGFREVDSPQELRTRIAQSFDSGGLTVLEASVPAHRSAELHRASITNALKKFESFTEQSP